MERMTLLTMTNRILSSMGSDKVESVIDTIESEQVKDIILDTYSAILSRHDWEFMKHNVRALGARVGLASLTIPADVVHVESVRYYDFDSGKFKEVRYISPDEYMEKTYALDTSLANVGSDTIGDDSIQFSVYTDRAPTYWTSFDEELITFDAYDSDNNPSGVDPDDSITTATTIPDIPSDDGDYFDIPTRMYPLLFWEAMSTCWLQVLQMPNQKAEQNAQRQMVRMTTLERRTVEDFEVKDYGRKTRGTTWLYRRR